MDLSQITPEFLLSDEQTIINNLQNASWDAIPSLNHRDLGTLCEGQLVRFRGMIQDMHDSEYYIDSYVSRNKETNVKIVKSGKYFEFINYELNEDVKVERQKELQTFYVISTPGENIWVKNVNKTPIVMPEDQPLCPSTSSKRTYEDEPMETEVNAKKQRNETHSPSQTSSVSTEYLLNFPTSGKNGKSCLVKVYDKSNEIKLNEVLEFIGFLRIDPRISAGSEEQGIEAQIHNPSPALIPRLHCVTYRKLQHENPLVNSTDCQYLNVRKELMIVLTQMLLGDELAAEYLLCHLISSVHLRKELKALGKFSVNLSNIPTIPEVDYVKEVYGLIEDLVTKSVYFPLTIENLNETTFTPNKDYETNRLNTGLFQLSPNTHILIDETKLENGNLNEAGIRGIQAMANIINKQNIPYDFKYYSLDFDCDIPFLVTSEGKSMLPSDFHVILRPERQHVETFKEIAEAVRHFLKPGLLNEIREYLTVCRFGQYELEDDMLERIQDKFLEMRRAGATADDLHNLLVLSRLVCLSYGKLRLDGDGWNIACKLEEARKGRISR